MVKKRRGVIKKGRPQKGSIVAVDEFISEPLPEKFYLEFLNGKNSIEISDLLSKYSLSISGEGSHIPIMSDIVEFQKELKELNANIDQLISLSTGDPNERQDFRSPTMIDSTKKIVAIVSKYLNKCHLIFDIYPVSDTEISPSARKDYQEQLSKYDNNMELLKVGELHRAKVFPLPFIKCQCDDILSWAVLSLISDKLSGILIRICTCGRPFIAKQTNQMFCKDKECSKKQQKIRTAKSRSSRKTHIK
ncbi:MAG: hypothetical protein WCO30_00355 [bacterium]